MLFWLMISGAFYIGNVDSIEGSVAVVEYKIEDTFEYKYISINKEICVPHEGQIVFFNDVEIIKCLSK